VEHIITATEGENNHTMDAFQRIAFIFKEDCECKLHLLEMVSSVIEDSDTVGNALRKLFFQSGVCPGDYDQISSLPLEMDRLRNCIVSMEVMMNRLIGIIFVIE
jgi:hypothetical protein